MNAAARLAAFTVALSGVFGGAVLLGGTVGTAAGRPATPHHPMEGAGHDTPAPAATARTEDGLEVNLRTPGTARAGQEQRPAFEVRDHGRPVDAELQPYLAAKGHLVALRAGDLAYLHTHPESDRLAFMSRYPSAGVYRLRVQFSYRGRVQTAAFTQEVTR